MGKKIDLRNKRRLKRLFERKKAESEQAKAERMLIERNTTERLEKQSRFRSTASYTPVIGIVLSVMLFLDWSALQFFNYQAIHQFGTFKSAGLYIAYVFVVLTVISKRKEKGWNTTLLGVSVMTSPLVIVVNILLSGRYEQELSDMLLCASFSALILLLANYFTANRTYNGLWIVGAYTSLFITTFYVYRILISEQTLSGVSFIGAVVFGLVLGWKWADCRSELPRTIQSAVQFICIAHIYAFLGFLLISTNLWVILFS